MLRLTQGTYKQELFTSDEHGIFNNKKKIHSSAVSSSKEMIIYSLIFIFNPFMLGDHLDKCRLDLWYFWK